VGGHGGVDLAGVFRQPGHHHESAISRGDVFYQRAVRQFRDVFAERTLAEAEIHELHRGREPGVVQMRVVRQREQGLQVFEVVFFLLQLLDTVDERVRFLAPPVQPFQHLLCRVLRRQRQFDRAVFPLRPVRAIARFEIGEFPQRAADFLDLQRDVHLRVDVQFHIPGSRQHAQRAHGLVSRNIHLEPVRLFGSQSHVQAPEGKTPDPS